MKKFIYTLTLCIATVALTACGSDDIDNTGNNGENQSPDNTEKPQQNVPFSLEISEVSATTARVTVTPKDKSIKYYFDLLRTQYYNEYNDKYGFQRFIDNTLNNLMEANNMTKEEVLSRILSAGDDSYGFTNLDANTEYYAVAMGVDSKGVISTDIVSVSFKTQDVESSNNTFNIELGTASYTSVPYSVKPSNDQDGYILMAWNKYTVDAMGDEAFIKHCINSHSDIEDYLVSGKQSGNLDSCIPGREYYLIAFGYEGGLATTGLTKAVFTTKLGGDASQCTFKFEVSDIQYDRAYMTITPSSKYNPFFWSVVEKKYYELRSAEIGHQATMEEVLAQTLEPWATDFGNINDALEYITSYDETNVEGTTYGLSQGTEYIPWAVCIDGQGKPIAEFAMGTAFKTKSDNISDCKITVKGSFYEGSDGKAVLVSTATPDDKCAYYYNVIFQGDLSESSRQSLVNNILSMGFKNTREVKFEKCPWNQTVTAIAVGVDAEGNLGEIAMDIFTPTK